MSKKAKEYRVVELTVGTKGDDCDKERLVGWWLPAIKKIRGAHSSQYSSKDVYSIGEVITDALETTN